MFDLPHSEAMAVFERYKQAINQVLATYFDALPDQYAPLGLPPIAARAFEYIHEFTLRPGKRVRGALAAMAYDSVRAADRSPVGLELAVVMEVLQSYILMLDDITDKSELRRGEPTLHRLYARDGTDKLTEHQSEQLAMYTAFVAAHLANELLANIDEDPECRVRTLAYIHHNLLVTGMGQMDDLLQEVALSGSIDDIHRKYAYKTSYYTFINPLQAGLALAGVADPATFEGVVRFGTAAGIAFQIHDDYLGVFSDSAETGKSNLDDLKEGKLTLLVQHVLSHGTKEQVNVLKKILGNPDITEKDLLTAREIMDACGATMEARAETVAHADAAIETLATIPQVDDRLRTLLTALVQYSITRKS